MSTPRTNDLRVKYTTGHAHLKDVFALAEKLERELAEAKASEDAERKLAAHYYQQNAALRAELEKLSALARDRTQTRATLRDAIDAARAALGRNQSP